MNFPLPDGLRQILACSFDGILVTSADGAIQHANAAACRILRRSEDELRALGCAGLVAPDDPALDRLLAARADAAPVTGELGFRLPDGSALRCEASTSGYRDAAGEAHAIFVLRGITETRGEMQQLRESNALLEAALANLPGCVLLVGGDNRIAFANPEFCTQFRLDERPEELVGQPAPTFLDRIAAEYADPEASIARILELVSGGLALRGEEIPMRDDRSALRDFIPIEIGGRKGGRLWFHVDITERKRTERALRASEERFSKAFRAFPVNLAITRAADGMYLEVNDPENHTLGYTREELVGRTNSEIGIWVDLQDRARLVAKLTAEGRLSDHPVALRHKSGQVIECRVWATRIELNGETCILSSTHDVNQRARAERQLQESEARFRSLTDLLSDWYWELDDQLRFTRVAGKHLERFELSPEAMLGRRVEEFPNFERMAVDAQRYGDARSQHLPYRDVQVRARLSDGTTRYMSISGEPLFAPDGRFRGYRGVTRDITDQYYAQSAQKRLYAALSNLDESFVLCDREDRIVMTSRSFREQNAALVPLVEKNCMFEEFLRAGMAQGYFPAAAGREEAWIAERLAQRRNPGPPVEVLRQDGVWMLVSDHVLEDGGTVSIGRDVTRRKQVELQLRESEERFRTIFEQSGAGMDTSLPDGTVLSVNRAFAQFLGYEVDELVGRNIEEFRPAEYHQMARDMRAELISGGADSYIWERPFIRRDGRWLWGRITVAVVRDAAGAPKYFMTVLVDITLEHEAKARIARLNADLERRVALRTTELQRANEELESFSYSVAHDLRTPLRAIAGFSSIARAEIERGTPQKARGHLQRIEANAVRMGRLIDDLLEFARTGRTALKRAPVDMRALVDEVINEVVPQAGGQVRVDISGLPAASGDAAQLRQVWRNLIGNALKFSAGKAQPRIEIGFADSGIGVGYFIRDNGCGFEPAYVDKLFGVFQRLHSTAEFEGSGIGLAIVKRIVEKHGGTVAAEATPGEGATFRFTLPGT